MYTAKPIPTLTGDTAERFEQTMQETLPLVDMKEAFEAFETIMKRSVF